MQDFGDKPAAPTRPVAQGRDRVAGHRQPNRRRWAHCSTTWAPSDLCVEAVPLARGGQASGSSHPADGLAVLALVLAGALAHVHFNLGRVVMIAFPLFAPALALMFQAGEAQLPSQEAHRL